MPALASLAAKEGSVLVLKEKSDSLSGVGISMAGTGVGFSSTTFFGDGCFDASLAMTLSLFFEDELLLLLLAEGGAAIGGGGGFFRGDDLGEGAGGRFLAGDGGGLLSGFFFGFCCGERTGFCRLGRALCVLGGTIGATLGGGGLADDSLDVGPELLLLLLSLEDRLWSLRFRPGSS